MGARGGATGVVVGVGVGVGVEGTGGGWAMRKARTAPAVATKSWPPAALGEVKCSTAPSIWVTRG